MTVHVDQGPPVMIDKVETFGFDVLEPRDQEAVQQRISVVAGRRRVQGDVRTTRTATLAVLQERGYAYATVTVLEAEGSAPGHVALYVIAEPGPQAVFGTITVRGNNGVSDGRVKSLLSMKEGQQFRISRVVDTQRRLYNREIFQFVSVNAEPTGTVGAPVPVNVVLTQAKPRRLSITPGYGSEEKARITTTLRHLNFFGGARTALATVRWSSLDRGVRLNVEEPSLFRRGISMSVGAQYWYADEPAYQSTTKGGRVTFAKQRERSDPVRRRQSLTTLSVTVVDEYEDYTVSEEALNDPDFYDDLIALGLNPNTGRGTGQLLALAVDVQRNTTPNLIDAKGGYLVSAHVEQAGNWMPGAYNYTEYTAEAAQVPHVRQHRRCRGGPRRHHRLAWPAGRRRAVLQALLPRWLREPARVGPIRGLAADAVRQSHRRAFDVREFGRSARPGLRQVRHRRLRRCRQRLVRDPRLPPRRACAWTSVPVSAT